MTTTESFIPVARPDLSGNESAYVASCLSSGWISSQGAFVTRFEAETAASIGVDYAVATSNGTTALHLALLALGIGPGDEVIVPSFTFIATANAVAYTGATPVFVDSEDAAWGMDPVLVARAVTERTRAIIPVHLYGMPCAMDAIMRIAAERHLAVIEDAAEAQGAQYRGVRVGGIGDVGCLSFFGNKILTTGEGGMVVTNRRDLYDTMVVLRDHGMAKDRRYWHERVGYNYRLTNVQAAIGCAQLERLDDILAARECIRASYDRHLTSVERVRIPRGVAEASNVCWLYTAHVTGPDAPALRDRVLTALREANIDCRPVFYPIHIMPPYREERSLPVAERLSMTGFNLPTFVGLDEATIARVCAVVGRALTSASRD